MNGSAEGPGATLRAARQSMEISCREVAEALNLPITTVEAIEANDYEHLPAAVFTRGYIRAYAKLLELDSDPVVASYPVTNDQTDTAEVAQAPTLAGMLREHAAWVLGAGLLLVVAILVALVVWLWPSGEGPVEAATVAAPAEAPVERPATAGPQTPLPPPAERGVIGRADEPGASEPVSDASATDLEPSAEATAVQSIAAAPRAETGVVSGPAQTSPGVRRISPTGSDRLSFSFSEDCWVEIKSATGANLYSDLNRAGRKLELVGAAPFRILLGYAPGVTLAFNGEPVALGPHTRNNVATLVLGQ